MAAKKHLPSCKVLTLNFLPFSSVSKSSFSVVPTRVPFGFRNSSFSDSDSSSWPLSKTLVRLIVQFLTPVLPNTNRKSPKAFFNGNPDRYSVLRRSA